jgi:hypothetical protein
LYFYIGKNYNNIYFKTFYEDQNKLTFTFSKCGCKTHRLFIMYYIYINSDRKRLYCPKCTELILETDNNYLLQNISVITLLLQNIFLYKIQPDSPIYNQEIFEKLS